MQCLKDLVAGNTLDQAFFLKVCSSLKGSNADIEFTIAEGSKSGGGISEKIFPVDTCKFMK